MRDDNSTNPVNSEPDLEAVSAKATREQAEFFGGQADTPPRTETPDSGQKPGAASPLVVMTVMTGATELTKSYSLNSLGALSKGQPPVFTVGTATTVERPLHEILDGLTNNQCLIGGVFHATVNGALTALSVGQTIKVVPSKQLHLHPGAYARNKENVRYAASQFGVMLFDADPCADAFPPRPSRTMRAFYDALVGVFSRLAGAAALGAPSASNGRIERKSDGVILQEKYGGHFYFAVKDAADIPRAGDVAFKRMILAGLGSIELAKNGAVLLRGLFDGAVFSPERVDFTAPAIMGPGLRIANRGEVLKVDGGMVDTREVFPDLSDEEEKAYQRETRRLRHAVPGDKAKAKRETHIEERVAEAMRRGATREQARPSAESMKPGSRAPLGPYIVLEFDERGPVTVGEVLASLSILSTFNGETLADPVEGVEYGRGKAQLYANEDGTVVIHSFAHGGEMYVLRDAEGAAKATAREMPPWERAKKLREAIDEPLRAAEEQLKDQTKQAKPTQKARRKWLRRVAVYAELEAIKAEDFAIMVSTVLRAAGMGKGEIKPSRRALDLGRYAIELILSDGLGLDAAEDRAKRKSEAKQTPSDIDEEAVEILNTVPDCWALDADGNVLNDTSSNLLYFLTWSLGLGVEYDEFVERVIFKRLFAVEQVSDEMLARWNIQLDAAVRDIYRLATDATMPWAASSYRPRKPDIQDWLVSLADIRGYNSATDALMAWQSWDGVKRLPNWGARYLGYTRSDPEYRYVCLATAHQMRILVGRGLMPGVKADEMLVPVGIQGERKTWLMKTICDTIVPGSYLEGAKFKFDSGSGHNHIAMATAGKLAVELAELRGIGKRDTDDLKANISKSHDTGRAIYGRTTYTKPRQFCFYGTANCVTAEEADVLRAELAALPPFLRNIRKREIMQDADLGFLVDETGNRRFLPVGVLVDKIDLEALEQELPQLIAEAIHEVRALNFNLRMSDELEAEAGKWAGRFRSTGGLVERVAEVLAPYEGEDITFTREACARRIGVEKEPDKRAMGAALRRRGFKSYVGNDCTRFYRGQDPRRKPYEGKFLIVPERMGPPQWTDEGPLDGRTGST